MTWELWPARGHSGKSVLWESEPLLTSKRISVPRCRFGNNKCSKTHQHDILCELGSAANPMLQGQFCKAKSAFWWRYKPDPKERVRRLWALGRFSGGRRHTALLHIFFGSMLCCQFLRTPSHPLSQPWGWVKIMNNRNAADHEAQTIPNQLQWKGSDSTLRCPALLSNANLIT